MSGTCLFAPPWCLLGAVALFGATGCPTVDLGDMPADPGVCRPDPGYYRDVIWPEVLASADPARSCVDAPGCHALATGRSALRLVTDLDDPAIHDRNYPVVIRFLNCGTPEASSLITKPLAGLDPHGGGDLFPGRDDPAIEAFLGWFGR
jgi:hypothetical protein